MLSLDLSSVPTLFTDRLMLRAVVHGDAEAVFAMRSDPLAMAYIPRPAAITLQDAIDHIDLIHEEQRMEKTLAWAITLKDDPALIGIICLLRMKKEHFRTEIGYILARPFWGRGLMTEAVATVTEHAFHVFNFHSVEAFADPVNTGSLRVLERNGYVREGHFKEDHFHQGAFSDTVVYSRINTAH